LFLLILRNLVPVTKRVYTIKVKIFQNFVFFRIWIRIRIWNADLDPGETNTDPDPQHCLRVFV